MTPQDLETQVLSAAFGPENLPDFSPWDKESKFVYCEGKGVARLIFPDIMTPPTPTELVMGGGFLFSVDLASFCIHPDHRGRGLDVELWNAVMHFVWAAGRHQMLTAIIDDRPFQLLRLKLKRAKKNIDVLKVLKGPFEYLGTPHNWAIQVDVREM